MSIFQEKVYITPMTPLGEFILITNNTTQSKDMKPLWQFVFRHDSETFFSSFRYIICYYNIFYSVSTQTYLFNPFSAELS